MKHHWWGWVLTHRGWALIGVLACGILIWLTGAVRTRQRWDQDGQKHSLGLRRVFPRDNPWNRDISGFAVDPHSDTLIQSIGWKSPLHPDFGTTWRGAPIGLPFVVVPGTQPKVAVHFDDPEESDAGRYPIPADAPVERGGSAEGDRHVIVVDKDHWRLYELFNARLVGRQWDAGSGAIFDLTSNRLRPAGRTSADAAGLPIFPGLVRYEEVHGRRAIDHALRFTCQRTRRAYVWPARHCASRLDDSHLPPMGMRVRLRQGFAISGFPPSDQVILRALKKYGMILADNGGNWFLSGAPDPRWNDSDLAALRHVEGRDFEVVRMPPVILLKTTAR